MKYGLRAAIAPAVGTALSPSEDFIVTLTTKVHTRWQWLRSRKAKLAGLVTATLAAPAAAFGIYLAVLHWDGNFHTVIPGELYRSAQLSPTQIETYVRENGIRSIVNLRRWAKDPPIFKINLLHLMLRPRT